MTTYNTGNPLGSAAAKDLYDNAQNFDHLSNDLENEMWPDRFGKSRLTWHGMEKRYQEKLVSMGWELIDSFQGGTTLTRADQALRWELPDGDGEYYRWDGSLPKTVPAGSTPDSTGGVGTGAWVGVGDASLRSDLTKYGATVDQIAHRVTTLKSFEEFGAIGDGVTNDTASMLAALEWLKDVPFGKLVGRPGANYLITQSLVMKIDGSYTQDVTSTRYLDFTGTVIVAGADNITCIRMSHDFCHIINPVVINPNNYSDVIAYAIAPETESQTTIRVSQQFCVMENPRARGTKIGLKFKPGPTVGGSNSGAYYHSIMNPNFERVDCGFYFERSVSGDNNNTRIHIFNPVHITGNCAFWIESTDSLRVYGGSCENITLGTWPADVPCAVRVVKTVSTDTQVAGNLHFYGYLGEVCHRAYQIDTNVGTYENYFDWKWVLINENPYRAPGQDGNFVARFDGEILSSSWDNSALNVVGCRNPHTGHQAIIIQNPDETPAELWSNTGWKFTATIYDCPAQNLQHSNSHEQILGALYAGLTLTTYPDSRRIMLTSKEGADGVERPQNDLIINGFNRLCAENDNDTALGDSDRRWSVVYADTSSIVTSDEEHKTSFLSDDNTLEREKKAAKEIKSCIFRYKFKKSIDKKGEGARLHYGVGAQTVGEIMRKYDLNPDNYAFWCRNKTNEGDRYGIRYEELIMFLMVNA